MSIFQTVKENVTARQAAEQYGLKISRNGMVCCPFHDDRHPSMKVEKGFCCFACGVKGDVITFVADFFHLAPLEAAKKLAEDFQIPIFTDNEKKRNTSKKKEKPKRTLYQTEKKFEQWEQESIRILSDYLYLLEEWKLIIKGDVRERMISIFDWERLDSGKDWTFVLRKKIKTKYGENAAHINHVNKKALNYFQYYRLKIDCDGEMEFDTFCDSNQDEAEEWNKICYAYDFVEDKHRGAQNQVEGLMYSDIDNIHAILLTREKTLPNISVLMNTLIETDAKERVSKELLLEAIDDFEKDNIDSRECISEWKSKVAAETEMITKKAMKKILNMRTGIASKFNRFLHEKYGVWIDGELRKGEFEATYQIGNLLNIKYEYNEKDYLDGRTFVYYVGAKSKRLVYPNACCMRKVISLGEELEYEEALPLMAVEFVRNSQYTVLPFPFKYLREYMEQC